jgi:hypothetical protein
MSLPMIKGYYTARASGTPITFGRSENGNTQIAVEFAIEDQDFAGETITWVGHFTDKTAARTIESLQIAGWQGDDVSELDDVPGSSALADVVSLTCDAEEYQGEYKLKVQWVNRPRGGRFKFKEQISGSDLKAFGAQLRATVKSVRASGGAPRAPRQQSTPSHSSAGGGDQHPNAPGGLRDRDDIPF